MTEPLTDDELAEIRAHVVRLAAKATENRFPADDDAHWQADAWNKGTTNAIAKLRPGALLAEIDRLRAELAKYVGHEPTIAEEMAYRGAEIDRLTTENEQLRKERWRFRFAWHQARERAQTLAADLRFMEQQNEAAEVERPSDDHAAVYLDQDGQLWADYPTSPPSDAVLPLVWASEQARSREGLAEDGTVLRRIGWHK